MLITEPCAAAIICGAEGLDGEEVMAEVGVDAVVKVLGRDVLPFVAVVVGGVVDEDGDAAEIAHGGGTGRLQRVDVEEIDLIKQRRMRHAGVFAALDGGLGIGDVFVHEGDAAALAGELLHQGTADAIGPAGDEYGAINERGIAGVLRGHGNQFSIWLTSFLRRSVLAVLAFSISSGVLSFLGVGRVR